MKTGRASPSKKQATWRASKKSRVAAASLGRDAEGRVRVSKLLTATGLAGPRLRSRPQNQGRRGDIEGEVIRQAHIPINGAARLTVRVGKRAEVAVIE